MVKDGLHTVEEHATVYASYNIDLDPYSLCHQSKVHDINMGNEVDKEDVTFIFCCYLDLVAWHLDTLLSMIYITKMYMYTSELYSKNQIYEL